jgi:DNA-binding IclR family transcriptional regulator
MTTKQQHTDDYAAATQRAAEPPIGSDDVTGNKATARVLLILSRFTAERPEWGVSELGRELSMTKNMVHRALNTLVKHGLVVRSVDSSRYEIGPSAIEFARYGVANSTVCSVADPFLRTLADRVGETVSLAVRNGRHVVTVFGVRGRGVVARRVPVGRVVPLHVSAAGRAILGHLGEAEIADYTSRTLERVTPETIVRPAALRTHLAAVRAHGYAMTLGDNVPLSVGFGIAFPLFDRDRECFASVTVAGPSARFDVDVALSRLSEIESVITELNRRTHLYSASEMGSEDR